MRRESENTQPEFTFDDNPMVVAEDLQGAIILHENQRFIVKEVRGYKREDIKNKHFNSAQEATVGIATGSPYRGTTLINISTGDLGLVMPISLIEISPSGQNSEIIGPGHVAKALGIGNNDKVRLVIEDPYSKVLRISTI
jgi:3-methyladenine DNA glycosylase Mpg